MSPRPEDENTSCPFSEISNGPSPKRGPCVTGESRRTESEAIVGHVLVEALQVLGQAGAGADVVERLEVLDQPGGVGLLDGSDVVLIADHFAVLSGFCLSISGETVGTVLACHIRIRSGGMRASGRKYYINLNMLSRSYPHCIFKTQNII